MAKSSQSYKCLGDKRKKFKNIYEMQQAKWA